MVTATVSVHPSFSSTGSKKRMKRASMPVGGLLRGLVSPAGGVAAWLPCHELLAPPCSAWQHWLSSLRLRPPCTDGFKLLLVLLLVSAALAEVRFIASSSMVPTLRLGDRAVAEKVTYLFRKPSIGDIVFFKVPTALQNYGVNKDVVFIKRVLATPGDFIEVRQGQLIINGVAQKEHYTATHASYTMEAMVCAYLYFVSIVSLNNIEELLLPGPEMLLTQGLTDVNSEISFFEIR